ncbi:MAG TPA: DUF3237 family protein [Nitrososphaerales archaeon]|nr:DUF3237 family protein [Nitrososphaerales archaeon]
MKLEPIYKVRFHYPKAEGVKLTGKNGTEEQRFYSVEGTCEGDVEGAVWGMNHPHRRTDETFQLNMQGIVKTEDSATIMLDYQGYGGSKRPVRAKPRPGAGYVLPVVGFARHVSDSPKYSWLNDRVCGLVGEVRIPVGITPETVKATDLSLVFEVAELVWEPVE